MRPLRADEIEVRVGQVYEKGVSMLLYKNARTDMQILDETFGQMNWQKDYKEIKGNLYCGIGIWDKEKSREKSRLFVCRSDLHRRRRQRQQRDGRRIEKAEEEGRIIVV